MGGEVLDVQIADLNDKHFSEIEKALHHRCWSNHCRLLIRNVSLVVLVNSGPMLHYWDA